MKASSTGCNMFKYILLFLFLFLFKCCSGQCVHVQQCSGVDAKIGSLNYDLKIATWNSEDTIICPRSDTDVPQWQVAFKDSSSSVLTNGTFCIREPLQSSAVCNKNGIIIFDVSSQFEGKDGGIEIRFVDDSVPYESAFSIRYAPTGVYPEREVVYSQVPENFIALNWYIYSSVSDPYIRTYHGEQLLTENLISNNSMKYSAHSDASLQCLPSSSSDSSIFYNLFVLNPTTTSAGEYTLVVDTYSATVTLVISPMSSSLPLSSSSLLMHSSSSVLSSSSSPSGVASSPNASPGSFNTIDLPIILPSVLIPLVVMATILIIVLITYFTCKARQKKSDSERPTPPQENKDDGMKEFIQQHSQDPGEHKVPLESKLQTDTKSTEKETGLNETDSCDISHKPLHQNSSPTTQSKIVPRSSLSPLEDDTRTFEKHTRITDLQDIGNGHTRSFPSTPKIQGRRESKGSLTSYSTSHIVVDFMREGIDLLKEIRDDTKKANDQRKKVVENTGKSTKLEEDQLEAIQNISGNFEASMVVEKDVSNDDEDDTLSGNAMLKPDEGQFANGSETLPANQDVFTDDDEGYCETIHSVNGTLRCSPTNANGVHGAVPPH